MVYESNYRFHDPVRYFTANDPYYWEIDNIPLKQLMENDLWLKDQLEAGLKITIDEIDRSAFSELKPYSLGLDNLVRVKPGRFTARINDPMVDFRLQELERLAGEIRVDVSGSVFENHIWKIATFATTSLSTAINKLTSVVADDALFMNGLYERAFAYETWSAYFPPFVSQNQNQPDFQSQRIFESEISTGFGSRLHMPLADALLMQRDSTATSEVFRLPDNYLKFPDSISATRLYSHLTKSLEHHFIKFWRGVVRTAVVDVAEELSIEVPAFNVRDFDYVDNTGQRIERPEAEIRIDLLFIYSKPVDTPYVKLRDVFDLQSHRKIYKPELGLVKGAGVILNKRMTAEGAAYGMAPNGASYATGSKIFASIADSLNTSGGFDNEQIYGSFPAPDDLMNLTPLLSEELESNSPLLLGQSILPIAYIVVRKPQTVSTSVTITPEDIIDIRPFFRTTELSYNERAGIAAAQPPLSFVNPVVTRTNLKETSQAIKRYVDIRFNNLPVQEPGQFTDGLFPRVIAEGYILGGTKFGPESTLKNFLTQTVGGIINTDDIIENFNYPTWLNQAISDDPHWDLAPWMIPSNFPNSGTYVADFLTLDNYNTNTVAEGATYGSDGLDLRLLPDSNDRSFYIPIFSCKKTITLDLDRLDWVGDYHVEVSYVNSHPVPNTFVDNNRLSPVGLHVSKEADTFTIAASWPSSRLYTRDNYEDIRDLNTHWGTTNSQFLNSYRPRPSLAFGHYVMHDAIRRRSTTGQAGRGQGLGACVLPSVHFRVIGIPSNSPNRFIGSLDYRSRSLPVR